ncbi:MAG: hypothetical protein SV108_03140 [Pseudomonadota bacterium]|nr:hypothetical protein [Pseudomonadota bacterium]HJO36044.1 hypothetical protein [Gammaproteobacteria bacterium]
MPRQVLPTTEALHAMLEMLLGEEIAVAPAEPVSLRAPRGTHLAVYVDDDDAAVALALADPALSAYAGAALTRVPPATAGESLESGELPENLLENLRETMNVLSRLLMNDDTPHLRLAQVAPSQATLPAQAALLPRLVQRADFQISIDDYGGGTLTLLTL